MAILIIPLIWIFSFPALSMGWIEKIDQPEDLPFKYERDGLPARMDMLYEVGHKYGAPALCTLDQYNQAMNQKYPGVHGSGYLGGIYLNTARQEATQRGQFSIWSIPNSAMTVEVYAYMKAFEQNQSCKDSEFIAKFGNETVHWKELKVGREDVCKAWHKYFAKAESFQTDPSIINTDGWFGDIRFKQEIEVLRDHLWVAHSTTLFHSWASHKSVFEEDLRSGRIHPEEYSRWNGWNKFVVGVLPNLNMSFCASQMWPHLPVAIPECNFEHERKTGELICTKKSNSEDLLTESSARVVDQLIENRRSFDLSEAIDLALPEVRRALR